ncbi:MAG TPA: patatin-like phospholipase family protein [Pseudonocardia sp.]|nr:patatin-like phospholipase family protein [Pseudonocardia sp.]
MATGQVVVESGHMIDGLDRTSPRFPPEAEPRVGAAVDDALDRWRFGPGDTAITQGARGADLLVAEHALRRGGRVVVLLAKDPAEFRAGSVELPGTAWGQRFDDVLAAAERVEVLPASRVSDAPYARANAWALEQAVAEAAGRELRVLAVWDQQEGDGTGGTSHFVRLARERGLAVTTVVPRQAWRTPNVPYWERQSAPGPKRLLALDGGGLRGLITLQVLARMETQLGGNSPGFVLSDYFDYIAGTSTGAIIAAGLALGKRVDDITEMYLTMAEPVFRRRFYPARLKSLYRRGALSQLLAGYYGASTALGDDRLRSLLLVVLHRTDTDSLWPLSNNTWAKYNSRGRPDCNLDLPLWKVVRGSSAAPVYFPPESIDLHTSSVLFQDGGITPFNNPALLLFQMATARQYRLGWPTGADQLLLVSVGTGFAPAAHANLAREKMNLLFNMRNVLKVVMNGSSVENDRLCRVLGQCRYGPSVDTEFDDPVDEPVSQSLFSYVRYNVDLSRRGLDLLGLTGVDPRQVGRLDAVHAVPQLQQVGQQLAACVERSHFAGFGPWQ